MTSPLPFLIADYWTVHEPGEEVAAEGSVIDRRKNGMSKTAIVTTCAA